LNVTENPVKIPLETENASLKQELAEAKAAAEKYKKDAQAATARAGKAAKKESASKTSTRSIPSNIPVIISTIAPQASHDPEADHGHETGKPHYIGAWQRFCPTCGDENPDFKDETQCEDCGAHLGAKETAEKLKACPNCGGHRAKRL
jgi:DNA-directed RNA polymerase subunit RPC12/RpoP